MISYLASFALATATLFVTVGLYRLWFHPLAGFPGPRLWAMSRLPMAYNLILGRLQYRIAELHEQYGSVVRLAPGDLSFTDPEAWDPIYAKRPGKPELRKDPYSYLKPSSGVYGLFFDHNEQDHMRMKRHFTFAFNDKSLRGWEPTICKYVDLLVLRLKENSDKPVDFADWFTYTAFDITSHVVFGESFGCLENSVMHPWMTTLFEWVAGNAMLGMSQRFWPLYPVLMSLVPKRFKDADIHHTTMTRDKLTKRLHDTETMPDFLEHVRSSVNEPSGMSVGELIESCRAFVVGGAETMSTALIGAIYYLLKNPATFQRLQQEIRCNFENSEQITNESVAKLAYQNAVIQEVLRLVPVVPGNLSRMTPAEGWEVAGQSVPGNVAVAVNMYAAFRSEQNFERPNEFIPERWLPESTMADKKKVYQPFSMGPRGCIGKGLAMVELRIILANIVFAFDLQLEQESRNWMESLPVYAFFERRPLMVKVTPRA